jgi:photoactive yellow protein
MPDMPRVPAVQAAEGRKVGAVPTGEYICNTSVREFMTFDDPQAISKLEAMTAAECDDLPFGVVGMTPAGVVTRYNRYEAEVAALDPERVIGKHFFREIAPCTNNYMVAGLYDLETKLDTTIPYVFTLRMAPTRVNLRLLKDAAADHQYLLVERS